MGVQGRMVTGWVTAWRENIPQKVVLVVTGRAHSA